MSSNFDTTAATFDCHRALPNGVPEAIRTAAFTATGASPQVRILDLGAGTGRIGKAFAQANDNYVGLDSSLGMLQEFAAQCPSACLIQGDGLHLPFADDSFDLVLLMQVLSGTGNSSRLIPETLRVIRHRGAIAVGQTVGPDSGVDAQLKQKLRMILEEMNVSMHKPKEARQNAMSWLLHEAVHHSQVQAAHWKAGRSPEQFIVRHRTGARFAALPLAIQDEALGRLSIWAKETFGALDSISQEDHAFVLDIFTM